MRRLLIVSAISPFPRDSGGAVRAYHELLELGKKFEVYYIYFKDADYVLTKNDQDFLAKTTAWSASFDISSSRNYSWFFTDRQPFWMSQWLSHELKLLLPQIIYRYEIEAVQIEFTQLLYLLPYLPPHVLKIYAAIDIATVSFFRQWTESLSKLRNILNFGNVLAIYLSERKYLPKADIVLTMSENDKETLSRLFHISDSIVVPNGLEKVHLKQGTQKQTSQIKFGYIGSFSHPPNKMAFTYFVRSIAPLLIKRGIKFKYFLAGNNKANEVMALLPEKGKEEWFSYLGFVKTPSEFYSKIDALVAPIFSGSGTRVKIFEAISYNIPVITTPIGAEGAPKEFIGRSVYLAKNAKEFERLIRFVPVLRKRVSDQRGELLAHHTWSHIFGQYAKTLLARRSKRK